MKNRQVVENYRKMRKIMYNIMNYCPTPVSRYVDIKSYEMKKEGLGKLRINIPYIDINEDIINDDETVAYLRGMNTLIGFDLLDLKDRVGPGVCTRCDDVWLTGKNTKIEMTIDHLFGRGTDMDVYKNVLYMLYLANKKFPGLAVTNEKSVHINPDVGGFHELSCSLCRYVNSASSMGKMKAITDKLYNTRGERLQKGLGKSVHNKLMMMDKKTRDEISNAVGIFDIWAKTETKWERRFDKLRTQIYHFTKERENVKETQGNLLAKDFKDHMRLFPKTISKDEKELEMVKFIREVAQKYEFDADGVAKMIELTGFEPEFVYHYIKDSRGSTTSEEDKHFEKYLI